MSDTSSPQVKKENETMCYDHVPWPVRPSPGINYDFIVSMYLGGCCLFAFFFLLEKQILAPLIDSGEESDNVKTESDVWGEDSTEKEADPWKDFAKGMQGMYYVFAPFLLCLPWSLIVRYFWMKEMKKDLSREKKDD
jgi:hypothetical protein